MVWHALAEVEHLGLRLGRDVSAVALVPQIIQMTGRFEGCFVPNYHALFRTMAAGTL
jgi:hypothetical protein